MRKQQKIKLTVGKKIGLGFFCITFICVIVGASGVYGNFTLNRTLNRIDKDLMKTMENIHDLNYQRTLITAYINETMALNGDFNRIQKLKNIKQNAEVVLKDANAAWKELNGRPFLLSDKRRFEELEKAFNGWRQYYIKLFNTYIDLLIMTPDGESLDGIYKRFSAVMNESGIYSYEFYRTMITFLNQNKIEVEKLINQGVIMERRLTIIIAAIIIFGACLSTLLGSLIVSSISNPIRRAFTALKDIVNGAPTQQTLEAISHDEIGEMTVLLRELNDMRERAEGAAKAKSRFLASMSHEIRTPMNAIIGMSELMPMDNLNEIQRDYFESIKKMSKSLLSIINDILDFSKIDAGKLEIVPVDFNTHALFDNLASMFKFIAAGKNLDFKSYLAPTVPETLFGDEIRIRQILTNIVNNAIKYTREGFVSFEMHNKNESSGKEYLMVKIADSGIGIKPENLPKLFEEFERFDVKKNSRVVGTGLGLAIAKNLTTLMGGRIEVESEYEKGSCFTVYIPLSHGDPGKVEAEIVLGRVKAKDDVRVLVVDDTKTNLIVAQGFLLSHNIKAEVAESGEEAIGLTKKADAEGRPYDIIFMDHMMPDMDGVETAKKLRDWEKEKNAGKTPAQSVPIIALSANAISGMKEFFIENGMNGFLSKPIEAPELNDMLVQWLDPGKFTLETDAKDSAAPASEGPEALNNDGNQAFYQNLREIKDLEVETGLSHIAGSRAGYRMTLKQFYNSLEQTLELMRKYAAEGDWKNFSIRVHGLKGVMRIIGHSRLGDAAALLEAAGKREDAETCLENLEPFCEMAAAFRQELYAAGLMEEDAQNKDFSQNVAEADFTPALAALKKACSTGRVKEIELAAKKIAPFSQKQEKGAEIKALLEMIESFEYTQAIKKIDELLAEQPA
ncbi:MAG: response regulator [Spirochaetaceae bacterium]|jgi:signal transduction histidine kinase/DNA-binding response OmpR family regulator|nr:response regulator [Spirochaetaceae bacterium]